MNLCMDVVLELNNMDMHVYYKNMAVGRLNLMLELSNMPENHMKILKNKYNTYKCRYTRAIENNGILYTFVEISHEKSNSAVLYYNYEIDLDSENKIKFIFGGFHIFNTSSAQIHTYCDYIIIGNQNKYIDINMFGQTLKYLLKFHSKKNIPRKLAEYGIISVFTTRVDVFNLSDIEWIY